MSTTVFVKCNIYLYPPVRRVLFLFVSSVILNLFVFCVCVKCNSKFVCVLCLSEV